MPRFIQDHLRNIPTSYRDTRSQRAKFRREDFRRPMTLDLMVRLLPLWLARVQKCRERPTLDFGEMVTSSEEVGYHLMLVGPELDFYLKVISKKLYRLLGLSHASGEISVPPLVMSPHVWWYLTFLCKKYGAAVEHGIKKLGDRITFKSLPSIRSTLCMTRVGRVTYSRRHFRKQTVTDENGQKRTTHTYLGRACIVCDDEFPFTLIYKSGTLKIYFYRQNYNSLNIPSNLKLSAY